MKKVLVGLVVAGSMAFAGYIGSGGVSSVKDASHSDKTNWYVVTCNDGKSYKIGKMSGANGWWGQSGGQLPSDFEGLSTNAAAEKACR